MVSNAGSFYASAPLTGPVLRLQPSTAAYSSTPGAPAAVRPSAGDSYIQTGSLSNSGAAINAGNNSPASKAEQLAFLNRLLPVRARQALQRLDTIGILDATDETQQSTLSHLFRMASTPRVPGLQPERCLSETVAMLDNPYRIKQNFMPLGPSKIKQLLQLQNKAGTDPHNALRPPKPRRFWELALVVGSNNCIPATILGELASHAPAKLARYAEQASSPALSISKTVDARLFSPQNPALAGEQLRMLNIANRPIGNGLYQVSLPVPQAALIRAQDAQQRPLPGFASGMQLLLQSMMSYAVTGKSYDAATDKRDSIISATIPAIMHSSELDSATKENLRQLALTEVRADVLRDKLDTYIAQQPTLSKAEKQRLRQAIHAESPGLLDSDKSNLIALMLDTPHTEKTYAINASPGFSSDTLVYGYRMPLQMIEQELRFALDQDATLLASLSKTDRQGRRKLGHEIRITGYEQQQGKLYFLVANSNSLRNSVQRVPAARLIPELISVTMPSAISQQLALINPQATGTLYKPNAQDASRYQLIPLSKQQAPAEAFTLT